MVISAAPSWTALQIAARAAIPSHRQPPAMRVQSDRDRTLAGRGPAEGLNVGCLPGLVHAADPAAIALPANGIAGHDQRGRAEAEQVTLASGGVSGPTAG